MRVCSLLIPCLLLPACATEQPPPACARTELVPVDPDGEHHRYVVDSLTFPQSAALSSQLGIDLDCDPQGRPDNALGQLISSITLSADYDLDYEAGLLIDAGEILHLIDVQAVALDDVDGVGLTVLHGIDGDGDPSDNFSGTEDFAIDASRGSGELTGSVVDGQLHVAVGTIPLAVTFPGLGEPFVIDLVGARIIADITPRGITGRIAGAVHEDDIDTVLLPIFLEGLGRIVNRDCVEGPCDDDSFGSLLLEVFDADGDGSITLDELRDNSITSSLLHPDVDLFDADGSYAPRVDDEKDGLSIGLGFTAVPAVF